MEPCERVPSVGALPGASVIYHELDAIGVQELAKKRTVQPLPMLRWRSSLRLKYQLF